jgi:hypothetical protein
MLFKCIVAAVTLVLGSITLAQTRVVDDMSDSSRWRIIVPEGVTLSVHEDAGGGADGKSLRLDYEFVTGGGYCLIQRELPMRMPGNYEFAFQVRGSGKENNLEFKLLDDATGKGVVGDTDSDASEHSVWWVNRRSFQWPSEWTRVSNKKRKFEFAWGPSAGAPLEAISKVEFAIASSGGGKGSVWLDELTFRELPTPQAEDAGEPKPISAKTQSVQGLEIFEYDFGRIREFGGVDLAATNVGEAWLETSDDGAVWTRFQATPGVIATEAESQTRVLFVTPDAEARFVRVSMRSQAAAGSPSVQSVRFREAAFSASPNSVVMALAKESPRGTYPKQFLNEASYWTVVGTPDSDYEALINEEGQIEVGKRMFSIEPFLKVDGKLLTWADGTHTQSLQGGNLPIPSVVRMHDDVELRVTALAITIADKPWLIVGYEVMDVRRRFPTPAKNVELLLAIRPYQVNPPWQRLNFEGGVAPIDNVVDVVLPDSRLREIRVRTAQGHRTIRSFSQGAENDSILAWAPDELAGLHGIAMPSRFILNPQNQSVIAGQRLLIPLEDTDVVPEMSEWAGERRTMNLINAHMGANWSTLGRADILVPENDAWLRDSFKSQIAYILINRDGPAIQPGSRSYERSWARDGSMTSSALLELGYKDEVRAWIDWFADHIWDNGKVPCVVDKRGPDPVPEHDSHGQYIWAVANYYRFTKDRAFLEHHWPKVQKVVGYIQSLRAERRTPEYANADGLKRAKFGLVPESISHEGYSAKPMHSYWDCFFVQLGLKEATYLAQQMGDAARAGEYEREALDFREKFMDSIARSRAIHKIDYIPGCVELGDFDSTSTTIALFPCDEGAHVDQEAFRATFERYWKFFTDRRDRTGQFADKPYEAYTPYELRHINAFVRMGWRDRAHELLAYFRKDQRPQGWHHWAEVVWNDPKTPKFVGDMPHTWCGSDFLNSVLAIFAYTELGEATDADDRLICFAGVSNAWIDSGERVGVERLRTPWGEVSLSMVRDGRRVTASVTGDISVPGGGLVLRKPENAKGEDVVVRSLPAEVVWELE